MTASQRAMVRKDNWYGIKPVVAQLLKISFVNQAVRVGGSLVLPSSVLYRLPVAARRGHYLLETGQEVILLHPSEDQVAKDLVWGRGAPTQPRDAHTLRLVEWLARDAEQFLDIGSYSGLFALIAVKANPRLHAIAFELLPQNYFATVANFIENDAVTRAEARLCGVGQCAGEIVMPHNLFTCSRPSSISLAADFEVGVSIPVIALDSLELKSKMLWKIDVEGFEWSVLQGALKTIRATRPDIICEILPQFEHCEQVESLLKPLGYRFAVSVDDGIECRLSLKPDAVGRDWIFTTRELLPSGPN